MFVSVSTRCFSELDFAEACHQIVELEFDRLEIWLDEESNHLKPSTVAANPEQFATQFRDQNRIPAIAFDLAHDVPGKVFQGICRASKFLRVTQISVPSSPLGTPFNSEIDRLKELVRVAGEEGVRVSIRTERGRLSEDLHNAVELCEAVRGLGLTFDPSYYVNPATVDKVTKSVGKKGEITEATKTLLPKFVVTHAFVERALARATSPGPESAATAPAS